MTDEELKLLKQYMHVDHDDDDDLIRKIWAGKVAELTRAGAVTDNSEDYWLAAAGMTLEAYDGTPLPPGVQKLINQLKLSSPAF